jgi:hypothetical protein
MSHYQGGARGAIYHLTSFAMRKAIETRRKTWIAIIQRVKSLPIEVQWLIEEYLAPQRERLPDGLYWDRGILTGTVLRVFNPQAMEQRFGPALLLLKACQKRWPAQSPNNHWLGTDDNQLVVCLNLDKSYVLPLMGLDMDKDHESIMKTFADSLRAQGYQGQGMEVEEPQRGCFYRWPRRSPKGGPV